VGALIDLNLEKDKELGLWKATLTANLPTITVTRYKADKDDFRYELSRAVTEIVEEVINREVERYDED
jgi:hypothetical protein